MSTPGLRRVLGLRDVVLFNIAAVAGVRWLAAAAHTGPGSVTLWLLAAALFFVPSALAVADLSERYPEQGGIYIWTKHAFGDWHGFLCGWCYWLSNVFYFPNLILAGVNMAGAAFGLAESKTYTVGISLAILWIALLTNLAGLWIGKWTSNAGAIATYGAGLLLIACGAAAWLAGGPATPIRIWPKWDWERVNFWSQIAFAFGGLELGAIMAGEIRDPRRTVPRAAWISGSAIATFYVAGTLSLLVLLPPDRISIVTGLIQAGQAAGSRFGVPSLGWAMTGMILLGVLGQLGAWIGGSARLPFVIGLDRHLPAAFARIHPRWGTPYVSLLFQGALCTAALLALQAGEDLRISYQLLVDMTVITYFVPFLYLFGAAWRCGRLASAYAGIAVTSIAIAVSLVPPSDAASTWLFEGKLVGGCALLVAGGRVVFRSKMKHQAQ